LLASLLAILAEGFIDRSARKSREAVLVTALDLERLLVAARILPPSLIMIDFDQLRRVEYLFEPSQRHVPFRSHVLRLLASEYLIYVQMEVYLKDYACFEMG
jgi:hypothetical protein